MFESVAHASHGRTYVGWSLILCLYYEAQTHSILISNNEDPLHLTFIKTVFFFVLLLKKNLWLHVRTASFYVLSKNTKNEILQPLKVTAYCIDMFA